MRAGRATTVGATASLVLLGAAQAAQGPAAVVIPSAATVSQQPAPRYVAPGATWTGQLVADVHDDWRGGSTVRYYLHRRDGDIELTLPPDMPIRTSLGRDVTLHGFGTDRRIDVIAMAPAPSAAAGEEAAVPLQCSTVGEQKAAVILMNQPSVPYPLGTFPATFWQEKLFSPLPDSVNSFLVETSSGQASLSGDVFGPFDFDRDYACGERFLANLAAYDAAIAAGVDLSPYTRLSVIYPGLDSCGSAAGQFGCSAPDQWVPNEHSYITVVIDPSVRRVAYAGVLAHELGHNFMLAHAHSADFGSRPLGALDAAMREWGQGFDGVPGTWALHQEYGDPYSLMGIGIDPPRSFSARDELALGWVPQAAHREVMSSGDFVLEPYELAEGLRAIRVLREDSNSSWLWLEYRQPIGAYDGDISDDPDTNLFDGAYVRYEDTGALVSGGITAPLKALHFNPSAAPNSYALAAMTPGQSWSDPYTPLRLEVNRADASGLSVSAHFEEPCAALVAHYVEPDVVIDVSAPETCRWQTSTAAEWLTLVEAGDGKGNGSIRYRAAANNNAQQRRAYVTVQRQSVEVMQKGTGAFVHPLPSPHIVAKDAALGLTVDVPGGATFAQIDVQIGRCWVRGTYQPPEPASVMLVETQQTIAPGSAGSISTDHCTLRGAGSQVNFSNDQLQVVFDLGLHASYGSFPIMVEGSFTPLVVGTWTVELPTHPMPLPPATPAGLAAVVAKGQVELTWSAAEGAVSYRVYEQGVEVKAAIGDTHAVITDLRGGTRYRFTVKAVNSAGLSAASNEVSAKTPGGGGGAIDPRALLLLVLWASRHRRTWRRLA